MTGEIEGISARLEALSEELADLAMASLRDSLDAGGAAALAEERRLARARRAVERAIGILREPDSAGGA